MTSVPESAIDINKEREGNTRPLSQNGGARVINPAKYWCFTIFNYSDTWKAEIVPLLHNVFEYCIGIETCPKTKKLHLQGYVSFTKKYRPLVSWEKVFKGIHFEKCKGSRKSNYDYCSKEGEFITNMNMKHKVNVEGMMNYWNEIPASIKDWVSKSEFELAIFHGIYKFSKFQVCENCRPDILRTKINEAYLRIYGNTAMYPSWWSPDDIHNHRMCNDEEYFKTEGKKIEDAMTALRLKDDDDSFA